MQQEGSSAEVWRMDDLFSMAGLLGGFGNRAMASTSSSVPSFMAASFYNMNMEMMRGDEDMTLDRALLASKNHREAERRRRERIKSHLDRLRHLLACDPKIDKATLLAKAVEHVRDLQQRAAEIPQTDHFPTETDEIDVSHAAADLPPLFHGRRRPVIKASMCCDDRSGLLPELIETLKSLRLRTLRAEIATLGGRVRNVVLVTREEDDDDEDDDEAVATEGGDDGSTSFGLIRDALKALVERPVVAAANEGRPKRRRILDPTPV